MGRFLKRPLVAGSTHPPPCSKAVARSKPRVRPSVAELYLRLLRDFESIIDFDAQVSHGAFQLRMAEQQLNRP